LPVADAFIDDAISTPFGQPNEVGDVRIAVERGLAVVLRA